MVLRMRSTLIVRAQNQNGSQIQALTAMACVCNHGPSVDSHHHCTAPLQHSSMTPPGVGTITVDYDVACDDV